MKVRIQINKFSIYIQILIIGFIIIFLPFCNEVEEIMNPIKYVTLFYFFSACSILFLTTLIFKNKKTFIVTRLDAIIIVYCLYKILKIFISGGADRYFLWSFLFLAIFYISLRLIKEEALKSIFYIFLVAMVVQSIVGESQLLGIIESKHSLYNITGSFFNPALLGGFICCILPINLIVYKENRNKRWLKIISFISMMLAVIILPATHSRAAILSAIVVFGCIYIKHFHKGKITKQNKYFFFVLISLILSGMYFFKKNSADGRILIWKVCTEMIREKPIMGYGPNGFEKIYMLGQANYFKNNPDLKYVQLADNIDFAYNELLKETVKYGVVGVVLFLLIFLHAIKVKDENKSKYALMALFIFGLFSYPSNVLYFRIITVILLACISSYDKKVVGINSKIFIPLVLIPFLMIKPMRIFYSDLKGWYYAVQYYNVEERVESYSEYKLIKDRFFKNGDFLIQYGRILSMTKEISGNDSLAIAVLNKGKLYKTNTLLYIAQGDSYKHLKKYGKAEECYVTAKNMVPNRFFPLYLLAKLYDEQGKKEKVVEIYEKMKNKEIKVPSTAINEMKDEVKQLVQ